MLTTALRYLLSTIVLILLLLHGGNAAAQRHQVYSNWNYNNPEKDKVFDLWKQYLTQPDGLDTLWCDADRKKFKGIDVLKDDLGLDGSLYKIMFDCSVLSISGMGENYLLKAALYFNEKDSSIKNKVNLFAIIDMIVVKQNNIYKLSNYINYSTAAWNTKTVGKIIYHYPQVYPFDIFKARQANSFLDSLQHWFACRIDTINYYIPLNCTDGQKMVGFEYYQSEGRELNLCGYYDQTNNIIYSNAIQGECYKHELIHQVNKTYPQANTYFLAGIAAYIDDAGSFGKSESFHIRRYREYLKTHPADLNKFYDISYIDEVTAPNYIFGAVICNALLRKGGLALLKKSMAANTRNDKNLITYLKETLNIKDFNVFFEKEFNNYLKQPMVLLTTGED